uniref:Interleukin 10 receptor subunit beta n=1 Tax=Cyanoderma ruficeps TaxID=181631 RepID=A0A8C3XEE2_9PASS
FALLIWGALMGWNLFSGMVPPPRNARITSVNLHSTLQWDEPRFPKGNITYTVRYKSINFPGDSYETLRTGLRLPRCDVSALSEYGDYVLQLRAQAGQLHSPWVTLSFRPMDDSEPPPALPEKHCLLFRHFLVLEFLGYSPADCTAQSLISQPSLCRVFPCFQVAQVDSSHSSEILAQLEPWTVYCVRVQAVIPEWNKTGELSRELCEQTTHNGVTPVWVIVTVLVGSMLVMVTAVTICFFSSFYLYRLTKHVFCPSYTFPQHLKEFLSRPAGAPQPFSPVPQEELLVCDTLTVISEQSQTLREGSGDEASGTPWHPQDSAQGDPHSGVGAASGKA